MSKDENKPNKYNNGKIYTIRCRDDNNLIYVGSTTQLLYKRFYEHKKIYNNENNKEYNKLLYIKMRELGIGHFYIELYENLNCDSKEQLLKREGQIIRELGTLNKKIEGRTPEEYYIENKDKIKEYYIENKDKIKEVKKEYYIENKDKIKELTKEYYIENKDKIKEVKKEYYIENKDKFKEYQQQNKDKLNERRRELYKLKKLNKVEQQQQPEGPITTE
jgi:hypothetical protein